MTQYIEKAALVAEIESKIKAYSKLPYCDYYEGIIFSLEELRDDFLNTLEVKDANEALRTEYEKGRADVIADTLSWLANVWPKYCSNQTIIEGFKEAIKYD
jgi:hypothetical protein